MNDYYLRVEGVNMDNYIFNTYDISTIRGGSYLIKEAIDQEDKWKKLNLECISLEANIGLFSFKASNKNSAEQMKQEVLSILKDKCDATFVTDITPVTDNFQEDMQLLLTKNRWRQWKELTVKLPKAVPVKTYCDLDGVSPGFIPMPKGDEQKTISEAASLKREEGIKLRKQLGKKLLNISDMKFTDDLETLAKDPTQGVLDGKIAFIYIDGNKFGSIRDNSCKNKKELQAFQNYVQETVRASALRSILDFAKVTPAFMNSKDIRLEVLMWGGDEIEMVVPAWLGWKTLDLFFKSSQNAKYNNVNLTHAAGVVFCHANAPILQIRSLARSLCNATKSLFTKIKYNQLEQVHNLIAILTLDSFDQLNSDTDSFVKNFFKPAKLENLVISAPEMSSIQTNMQVIRQNFPRNKVYKILESISNEEKLTKIYKESIDLIPKGIRDKVKD
jgi:hypothetical protein